MRSAGLVFALLLAAPALAQESLPTPLPYSTCEGIATRMDAAEQAGKKDTGDDELMRHCIGSFSCDKSREAVNTNAVPQEALASNAGLLRYLKDTCSRKLRLQKE